jgi:hypothetical protein
LHLPSATDLLGQVEKAIHQVLERFQGALDLYSRAAHEEILASDVKPALIEQGLPRVHARVIGGRVEAGTSHNAIASRWAAYNVAAEHLTHEIM